MGVHSTISVGRTKARQLIAMFAQVANDEDLGNMMDVLLYDRLYNCSVVDDNDTDAYCRNDELAGECLMRYLEEE